MRSESRPTDLRSVAPFVLMEFDWKSWVDRIPVPEPYRRWGLYALGGLVALLILKYVLGRLARILRRRRPPTIHPLLQKYSVDNVELDRKRRGLAAGIVATSTGNRLAGFRIVRQVEAVFVEGFKTPDEAIVGLKATAVERGANAILNVQTDRTAAGRCTASGDAVLVAPLTAKMPERRNAEATAAPPPRLPSSPTSSSVPPLPPPPPLPPLPGGKPRDEG